jgi:hypothetical protein
MVAIVLLTSTGCAESELAWFETEHLRVRGHAGAELCAGTPPLLEREVVRLAAALALPEPEETIDVLVGPDAPQSCAGEADACTGRPDSGYITVISAYHSLGHELVHAVRQSAAVRGPNFYEEGLAEVFAAGAIAANAIQAPSVDASELDALQLERLATADDYAVAASFVAWLRDRADASTFVHAFSTTAYDDIATRMELEVWFASAFGIPLASAYAQWIEEAPSQHVLPGPCVTNEPIVPVVGRFEAAGRLDCDDPATLGPSSPDLDGHIDVQSETCCVDVDHAAAVELTLAADPRLRLEARLRDCETHDIRELQFVGGGESEAIALEPRHCRLDLRVVGPHDLDADYRWTLELR